MSRLLRDPGRVEGGQRHRTEEVLPQVGAPVPSGQEQGSGRGRSV